MWIHHQNNIINLSLARKVYIEIPCDNRPHRVYIVTEQDLFCVYEGNYTMCKAVLELLVSKIAANWHMVYMKELIEDVEGMHNG